MSWHKIAIDPGSADIDELLCILRDATPRVVRLWDVPLSPGIRIAVLGRSRQMDDDQLQAAMRQVVASARIKRR